MPRVYEICGDEAWVHCNKPLNRYWCFFGGLLASQHDADCLESDLLGCLQKHNHTQEVKWNNFYHANTHVYNELIDILIHYLTHREIRYRQLFLDRTYQYVQPPGELNKSNLDIQFHICYQFLRHSFGLQFLPKAVEGFDKLLIRLDTHSSQKHKRALKKHVEKIPIRLGRTDLEIELAHICSHHLVRVGVCDLLLGAAGSFGNKIHDQRAPGQNGRTRNQNNRYEFAKGIYDRLRKLNKDLRHKNGFNWFESTSFDGDKQNTLNHKIRFWKFIPNNHKLDKGWQNKFRIKDSAKKMDCPF